jgi:GntR family transcriptional repressor for pyruvate dehydrogenase complex
MTIPLEPIKPKRISDQVFDQLRELIFRGELKPGDKVMPERELSAALNVSRTSVREAINKLVVMGLLEQKQGQGTFVRNLDPMENNPLAQALGAQNASLADLLEVRMGLECNAAFLAAQRAVEQDIHFLEKSLEEMKRETRMGRLGTEADVSFHMAICFATKNPVQVHIMKIFYDYLYMGIKENLQKLFEKPENIEIINEQHTEVFDSIRKHDPQQAFAAMKRHITFVLDFVKGRMLT